MVAASKAGSGVSVGTGVSVGAGVLVELVVTGVAAVCSGRAAHPAAKVTAVRIAIRHIKRRPGFPVSQISG